MWEEDRGQWEGVSTDLDAWAPQRPSVQTLDSGDQREKLPNCFQFPVAEVSDHCCCGQIIGANRYQVKMVRTSRQVFNFLPSRMVSFHAYYFT